MIYFNLFLENLTLHNFFLKEDDKVLKELGSGCFEVFLIQKSLFKYYLETRNLFFILFPYLFIVSFNTYLIPIKDNPEDQNNPFSDFLFLYGNSFLFIQLWLIDYTKKKVLESLEQFYNNILNKLEEEKEKDRNNTYCEECHCCCNCDCSVECECDCGDNGTYTYTETCSCSCCCHCHCDLIHYLQSWDNLKSYIQTEYNNLKNQIETEFNDLKNKTIQLFQLRLYWTFLLTIVFVRFPTLALNKLEDYETKKEKITKIDKALLYIAKYNGLSVDYIKRIIKNDFKVSENAVNLYFHKLKRRGFIRIIERNKRKKVYLTKTGLKKVEYLKEKYKGVLNGINDKY